MKNKRFNGISWLRCFWVFCILLCHYVAENDNSIIQMTGQIFNIGVPIFFIISGFLFGAKKDVMSCGIVKWCSKRIKRIYLPYILFLSCLVIVYLTKGLNVWTKDWLMLLLGLQGSVVGVWGAEQTWFVTSLLICYMVTPVIAWVTEKATNADTNYLLIGEGIVVCILPLLFAMQRDVWVSTLLSPVSWYTLAYILGSMYDKFIFTKKSKGVWLLGSMVCAFVTRLIARYWIDGTMVYERIVVHYTQGIAAFCILGLFLYLFDDIKPIAPIRFVENISFEIYLYHYMFTVGPVSLFEVVPWWPVACVVVTIVTVIISAIMKKVEHVCLRSSLI